MTRLLIGMLIGFTLSTGASLLASDADRPFFGFTPEGIAPIDRHGNQYDLSPSRRDEPRRQPPQSNPC